MLRIVTTHAVVGEGERLFESLNGSLLTGWSVGWEQSLGHRGRYVATPTSWAVLIIIRVQLSLQHQSMTHNTDTIANPQRTNWTACFKFDQYMDRSQWNEQNSLFLTVFSLKGERGVKNPPYLKVPLFFWSPPPFIFSPSPFILHSSLRKSMFKYHWFKQLQSTVEWHGTYPL